MSVEMTVGMKCRRDCAQGTFITLFYNNFNFNGITFK